MTLPAIFDPFAEGAAATVMTRMALEWLIDDDDLDQLFEDQAEAQYTRERTLSHLVNLMLDVARGIRPSPRAAFEARRQQLRASAVASYGKLKRMEPQVTAVVVRHLAGRARELIAHAGGLLDEPAPGYAARILDGNALAGTERRATPLRGTRAAGPDRQAPGRLRAGQRADPRRGPQRGRLHSGTRPARPGAGRSRAALDRRPELLRADAPLRDRPPRRLLPGAQAPEHLAVGAGGRPAPGREGRDRGGPRAGGPGHRPRWR